MRTIHATENVWAGTDIADQIKAESEWMHGGARRDRRDWADAMARGHGGELKSVRALRLNWYGPFVKAIRQEQRECAAGKPGVQRDIYGPFIRSLPAPSIACITTKYMLGAMMECSNTEAPRVKTCVLVGQALLAEMNLEIVKARGQRIYIPPTSTKAKRRISMILAATRRVLNEYEYGDVKVAASLGWWCCWTLKEIASCKGPEHPFVMAIRYTPGTGGNNKGGRLAKFSMTDELRSLIERNHRIYEQLQPLRFPMVCVPFRHSKESHGGYISNRSGLVIRPCRRQRELIAAADMARVWEAVHAADSQPWAIQRQVLEVAQHYRKVGGLEVGFPQVDDYPLAPPLPEGEATKENRKKRRAENREIHLRNAQLRSRRRSMYQRLVIASEFAEKTFWFPHKIDTRGRLNPLPQYLNHHGDDFARGLLTFGDSRPMDESGLRWLKIHAANCFGIDKVPFDDRVRWADQNMDRILECAARPLDETWWHGADGGDGRWQFLSACFALADPDGAGSRLPVQVDGSCNGLQHFAALMRDEAIAKVVNLLPSDAPNDAYGHILRVASESIYADARAGHITASLVAPHVGRKVVKTPTMSKYYGVTDFGASKQVITAMEKAGVTGDFVTMNRTSRYVASAILGAARGEFGAADRCMAWMQQMAGIACDDGQACEWYSSLGFPVVQPYRNTKRLTVDTNIGDQLILGDRDDERMPPARKEQVNAIAANAVHTIDADHAMRIATRSMEEGLGRASVFDAFRTHAATMDRLHDQIIPETFVELHEQPLLERLHADMQRICKTRLPDPPERGSLDLPAVLRSTYLTG